jgi:hypothetical protein
MTALTFVASLPVQVLQQKTSSPLVVQPDVPQGSLRSDASTSLKLSHVAVALIVASRRFAQTRTGRKATRRRTICRAQPTSWPAELFGDPPPQLAVTAEDPSSFTIGILGDLHIDPRDLVQTFEGRDHMVKALEGSPRPFLVSLGDLGESKDCTETKQLFSGTTPCFELAADYLKGFGVPFDVVGGNHDLEGIDEFPTDEANLEAYLRHLGKKTPQFCHQVAEKVLVIGLGSTCFRGAQYTSHEVSIDQAQIDWFQKTVEKHPADDGWQIFVFSHAPIIGSALRVLQTNHVVNGCCWLNHTDAVASKRFIQIVRSNSQIKAWFSGHFHLSHDYEDSITFPDGNNRGSCVFAQTGVMTSRSSRDGRRHSRFLRGNSEGFEICTVDHSKGGKIRLDATVKYSDVCFVGDLNEMEMAEDDESTSGGSCSVLTYAHKHEDYDHDKWFSAYVPQKNDGCYLEDPDGTINPSADDNLAEKICWWHMKDGAVLGVHNGMVIEYDATTLAPLGMVVSRDELQNRKAAVIDDEWGGSALILYDEDGKNATVVQPNEDGSYWRKVVRNKMHRMKEMRRVSAAKKWIKAMRGDDEEVTVLSSYGPYKTTAGQVMGLTTKAINPKAVAHQ